MEKKALALDKKRQFVRCMCNNYLFRLMPIFTASNTIKMRKICLSLCCAACILFIYACKKEVVEPQLQVQKQILGRWPRKYEITTVYIDNITMWPDTTIVYNPIDTLVFGADGKVVIRRAGLAIGSMTYSIDAEGQHITFDNGAPQKLSFVRFKSIGFTTETIVKNGTSTTRTVKETQLIK